MTVSALEQRGLAQRRHYSDLYEALLAANRFDEADRLRRTHADLDLAPFPPVLDSLPAATDGHPTLLKLDAEGNAFRRVPLDFSGRLKIVVAASPFCGFSRDATLAIEADPELSPLFRRHGVWAGRRDRGLDAGRLAAWNRAHPDSAIALLHERTGWPVGEWATPTFYIYRNGILVRALVGWPHAGRRLELLNAINEALDQKQTGPAGMRHRDAARRA